jgi:hypothetical protein
MTALRHRGLVAAAAVALAVVAGCGQDAQTLDSASTAPLHQRVQAVRVALEAQDANGARTALSEFRADVQRLADGGGINRDDAQVLVAHAERIDAALPPSMSAPQSIPAPQPGEVTVAPDDTRSDVPTTPRETPPTPEAPREPAPPSTPRDDPRPDNPRPDNPRPSEPDLQFPDRDPNPDPQPAPEPEPEPQNPDAQEPAAPAPDGPGEFAGDTGNGANDE